MKNWLWLGVAVSLTLPALYLRLGGIEAQSPVEALLFGLAILGAAFLLSWAAEVAQIDISQPLALALLALIAVLPEYAVDMYFAWTAGKNPEYASYAAANMTGANRLLIGFGWALVVFLFWFKSRKTRLDLEPSHSIELFFLAVATLYSFTIPLRGSLSLLDTVVLLSLFGLYLRATFRAEVVEPELVGPSRMIAALPTLARRLTTVLLFLFSAAVIFSAAAPFAEGLVQTGRVLGVDTFILVQWVAPLASEAPEIFIAAIFALRASAGAAMGILLSSKVNQWTLLVGCLPLVYALSSAGIAGLPLDARQVEEVLLTSAQSAFAIAILADLRFSLLEGGALFVLFGSQLIFTDPLVRYGYSGLYLLLTAALLLANRGRLKRLFLMAPYALGLLRSPDSK